MKALALNGSPHMDKGNTALILTPFMEGLEEEGVEVELFYVYKLKINRCLGELGCWTKTPGKCTQNDDVAMLLPRFRQADILVFATPVYVDGMTGAMKTLIDRTIPIIEPCFQLRGDHCRHPPRSGNKRSKVALVSSCGFWEMDNFEPLILHMKAICKNASWDYAGALLRPHSDALRYMLRRELAVNDVIEAAKEAGKQLAKEGKMTEETLKIVTRELTSRETYMQILNGHFDKALKEIKKESQFKPSLCASTPSKR